MSQTIRILLTSAILLYSAIANGQMPVLKVDGAESRQVVLQKLDVDVKVAGAIATTTWTMTFKNNTSRILEGELTFPLPEGITVSGYAIDINGKLREAVPVNKAKGTTVLEAIEKRRIDPGLLEKVEGNSFRTRIYPIRPNNTRTVAITYQEELKTNSKASLAYRLPLGIREAIPELNINVTVLQSPLRPRFEAGTMEDIQFDTWGHSWTAKRSFTNYQSDKPLLFSIPQNDDMPTVMMEESGNHYYYLINAAPKLSSRSRQLSDDITILWDVSLSSRFRNMNAELELLDLYFKRLQHATVTLVQYSNKVQPARTYTVNNGNWEDLKSALRKTIIDGGTQPGLLNLRNLPGEEFLLFSDGLATFGKEDISIGDKPIYCIASSMHSDFQTLKYYAQATGGELINLTVDGPATAIKNLTEQPLNFIGIKPNKDVEENYPSIPARISNGLTVAGISYSPKQEVVLQYGFGNKVTMEQKVVLDANKYTIKDAHIDRIWAQKKIADLDLRYDANKATIEQLGKRFGLVTRNTSLIVLESLNDYLTYEIEPPLELKDEYDRAIKLRDEQRTAMIQDRLSTAERSFDELLEWWKADYSSRLHEKKKESVTNVQGSANHIQPTTLSDSVGINNIAEVPTNTRTLRETRVNAYRSPLITTKNSEQIEKLVNQETNDIVALGANTYQSKQAGGISIAGGRSSANLYVVDGVQYPATNAGTANFTVSSPDQVETYSRTGERDNAKNERVSNTAAYQWSAGSVQLAKPNFDNNLISQLREVSSDKQYMRYLELRKTNLTTPSFYFQIAGYFVAAGQKEIGLRILSNLAELEMENYELYKMLGYKLRELGEYDAAVTAFRKVMLWRPMDPQSFRDYGLALADAGYYQQALDTLYTALTMNVDASLQSTNTGIEETLVTEINDLIALHGKELDISRIPRSIQQNNPVDIRVALNWNMKNTDIDLWVTDPNNEKCYYSHKATAIGGRISQDFTQGFGPEQFMVRKAVPGKYKVEVNYYGDQQVKIAGFTTVMAEVYTGYGTTQQKRQMMVLQMANGDKGGVYVGTFDFKR